MNSRERILTAIGHKEPDHVPVDLGSMRSTGISAVAYHNLNKHLGFSSSRTMIYDPVQELAQPEAHILDHYGIDCVDVGRAFMTEESDWYEFPLTEDIQAFYPSWFRPKKRPDGSWEVFQDDLLIAKKPWGATFFDGTYYAYSEGYPENFIDLDGAMAKSLWAAMPASPWYNSDQPGFWELLRERTLSLRQSTDRALMISAGCNLFEWGTFLRRLDNFLMDVYADPINVKRLVDSLLEGHLAKLAKICESVGDIVDIIVFGDDLGMDSSPFMAPEIYRDLFKPGHQALCEFTKKNSSMHTFLHSCGSIYLLMPDLIEAGFEIFNPVQTNANQMEPERLKKEFGKDITFWGGGIDTRTVLNIGSPQAVKDQVRRRIETFAPGGGFVFNTVHNILPDIPPENIVAMYEAVDEYR